MRTIFDSLAAAVLLAASLLPAAAQSEVKYGFVRLANAVVQGSGPLEVEIEGAAVNDKGYKTGDVTGGIRLQTGMRSIRFTREGTKEGTTRVQVDPNETTILIPFAEKVPASDEKEAHWAIRVLRLKQKEPEHERSATFVSVSRNPEVGLDIRDPDGKWNPVHVKRLSIATAPIRFPRGYVPLRTADGELPSIPVASTGNYVVVLYDDDEDKLKSVNFRDRKFLSAD